MQGLNKVLLLGWLGRSPEMRYTPDGKPVTSFSIVITYNRQTENGESYQETDWFNAVAWGTLAEQCRTTLNKGQWVFIEGYMKNRRWQDAQNIHHSCAEVIVQDVMAMQNPAALL